MALKDATPLGFKFGGARCGLKNKRNDMGVLFSEKEPKTAAVVTTNQVRASCVDHTRAVVDGGSVWAVVVNSGNANCCTGDQGVKDTATMAALAAAQLSLSPKQVAVGSTGVIGHVLDMAKVERGILDACAAASEDPAPFMDAILTTDLVEKWASWASEDQVLRVPGDTVPSTSGPKVFGVAKGSGMMAPNMGTMLSYVVTDYDASEIDLSALLRSVASRSFNSMTVDGDTSTNDMLLLFANGASGIKPTFEQLEGAVGEVCVSLAKQIAKDGEGATKLVEVQVTGSANPRKVARTIAESPLVKTAMFGCDPNWGRVLMAAGRAGVPFEPRAARLALIIRGEEHLLFDHGTPASFDPDKVSAALKSDHVLIDLRLGEGETATVYTCDFGYGYVRINAEYHT